MSLRYLSCDDSGCYPPFELERELAIEVAEGRLVGALAAGAEADPAAADPTGLPEAEAFAPEAGGADVTLWVVLGLLGCGLAALLLIRARS